MKCYIDDFQFLDVLAKHESELMKIAQQRDKDQEDLKFSGRMLHNLALASEFVAICGFSDENVAVLCKIIKEFLDQLRIPDLQTSILLIKSISQAFLKVKSLRKKAKKAG